MVFVFFYLMDVLFYMWLFNNLINYLFILIFLLGKINLLVKIVCFVYKWVEGKFVKVVSMRKVML